jgi:hypothetical protein
MRPWACRLDLADEIGVVQLTFDAAEGLGIAPDALVDDDWSRCQRWAEQQPDLRVLIAPSAALPGTENLILFGPKLRVGWSSASLGSRDVRTEPVADLADVVVDLLGSVRWRGEPHLGYEAWVEGRRQPPAPRVRVERPNA